LNQVTFIVSGNVVKDHRDEGILSLTGILQKSSNIGVTKVTLALSPNSLPKLLRQFGFGKVTDSTFPGEVSGVLPEQRVWRPFALATLSFGYGASVTTLQLAQAYTTFAANGVKKPVSLLKLDKVTDEKQIVSKKIANEIVTMMRSVVVTGGTSVQANIPGYTVSGKSGTSRIVGPYGYDKHRHIAVFAGIAPATKPRLVVVVQIKDPQNKSYYGGLVSAPIFAKVMAGALRILDVPPDDYINNVGASHATPSV
jgi:cell division protein FtsI (penicillin-binding protein 3)